ncbi:class I SAM-dependent methyltransferase [Cellulosimicrobium arenosum]|uniref:Class I SAM-dependent methyltransferase n=1 Tax=Cellulosimicrobium arenosum TaxID=2708133 RepID=A0A927J364_9MICO|nr:class I SAM-dependent methyltransferase [Cellulosimicrobium arenosum]MBD8080775.1 class I SAM-dependent methyltransferase [Cellulosimicrobium arenosum]
MRARSLAVFCAIAVAVVVGVVAALLGSTTVALAVLVALLGGVAALAVQTYRRTGAAVAHARTTEGEARGLRKELARQHDVNLSATDQLRRQVARTDKSVARLQSDLNATMLSSIVRPLDEVSAKLAGLDSDLRHLRKRVESVRNLAQEARPGKLLTQVQALEQLRDKFDVSGPLPDVGGWALDPTALLWLIDEIEQRRPEHVVECGSGTSTFWIAMALRQNGRGQVISLDHLEEFAVRTRSVLERHGLTEVAEVRHAPLIATQTPRGEFQWYGVNPATVGPIDLLVVDGPPEATGPLARYPALPLLHGSLTADARVLVDDVHRDDEKQAIEHWLEELPRLRRGGYKNDSSEVLTYG